MSVRAIEAEVSIKSGVQAECTIGREVVVEVHEEAVLEPLTVTANGSYEPSEGVNGFSDVTVSVPERIPVTEPLSVTQNGTYEPDTGLDGYDRVTVAVPPTIPDISPLTVTENGTYTASGDGYNPVVVNVQSGTKIKTGTYRPPETYTGNGNREIVSIADIGFTPSRFYLQVKSLADIGQTQYGIIRASYEKIENDAIKLTTRYTNASGAIATAHNLTDWTTLTAAYLNLVDGKICYRTSTGFTIVGNIDYEWMAIE